VAAAWVAGVTLSWLHFAFGLFAAAGLRLHVEFRKNEAKESLDTIQQERAKREEAERALAESRERYDLTARSINDGVWDWDLRSHEVYFSPRWLNMLGHEGSESLLAHPREWLDRVHPDDRARLRELILNHVEGGATRLEAEYRIRHEDGQYRWASCRGLAVRDGEGKACRIVGSQTDVTARRLAEEQAAHDAMYDVLSGLPNRALFVDRVGEAIKRMRRYPDYVFGLLYLDLDRFKVVNDSLGPAAGDTLLKTVGERLRASVRGVDTVARLGGDEFAVLLGDLRQGRDILRVVERIRKSLRAPFLLDGQEIFTSVGIGAVVSSSEYTRADEMLRDADTALHRAKASSAGGFEIFTSSMGCEARITLIVESELREALQKEEFQLRYQPILSLQSGELLGFDAAPLWKHPSRGCLAPEEFFATAAETGLSIPIGWQMLRQACRQLGAWQERYPQVPPTFVNLSVSAKLLAHLELAEQIVKLLGESGVQAGSLRLSVIEGSAEAEAEVPPEVVRKLRSKGVAVYLDGCSANCPFLRDAARLPVRAMRIDKSLAPPVEGDCPWEKRPALEAALRLAETRAADVIVEGVETLGQFEDLQRLHRRREEGFYFSQPVEVEIADQLLKTNRLCSGLRSSPEDRWVLLKEAGRGQAVTPSN
jgi:diguanylate cyclase (GGDEF)-like protein/PAS domain S-box-containing protein